MSEGLGWRLSPSGPRSCQAISARMEWALRAPLSLAPGEAAHSRYPRKAHGASKKASKGRGALSAPASKRGPSGGRVWRATLCRRGAPGQPADRGEGRIPRPSRSPRRGPEAPAELRSRILSPLDARASTPPPTSRWEPLPSPATPTDCSGAEAGEETREMPNNGGGGTMRMMTGQIFHFVLLTTPPNTHGGAGAATAAGSLLRPASSYPRRRRRRRLLRLFGLRVRTNRAGSAGGEGGKRSLPRMRRPPSGFQSRDLSGLGLSPASLPAAIATAKGGRAGH